MILLKQNNGNKGTYIGLLAPAIWSSYAVFAVLLTQLPQFEVLSFSYFFACIMMWCLKGGQKTPKETKKMPLEVWFAGICGLCVCQFLYLGAFRLAPPAQADLINYLWPVFLLFGGQILVREKLLLKHYLSAMLCFIGLVTLFMNGQGMTLQLNYVPGYLLALGCALFWTYYSLILKKYHCSTKDILDKLCLIGFVSSLAFHWGFESFVMPTRLMWVALIFSGAGAMTLAYLCWDYGMRHGNISVLATASYGIPVASISLLIIFHFASPSWNLFAAAMFISAAGWMSLSKVFAIKIHTLLDRNFFIEKKSNRYVARLSN